MTAVDGREWLGSVQTYAQLAEGGVGRYVHVPGERTRLTYYVDEALKEAGFTVRIGVNPSAVKLLYEPGVGRLTGNGPQTIDAQARKIRSIVSTRPVLNGGPLTSRVRERGRRLPA